MYFTTQFESLVFLVLLLRGGTGIEDIRPTRERERVWMCVSDTLRTKKVKAIDG